MIATSNSAVAAVNARRPVSPIRGRRRVGRGMLEGSRFVVVIVQIRLYRRQGAGATPEGDTGAQECSASGGDLRDHRLAVRDDRTRQRREAERGPKRLAGRADGVGQKRLQLLGL